ncbi:MAG: trypsin-like peptidase domain-containing protein [Candidatus Doudnabacteria bacterium]|nr:trypsin-like peptidase domain-containing protein [Candidatus Doudnabacteria bacterium]
MNYESRIKEDNKMKNTKKVLSILAATLVIFLAGSALGENIKLNPIKPGTKAASQLTDEQQSILAVRTAKASVVNIVGKGKPASQQSSGASSGPVIIVPILPQETVSGTGVVIESSGLIATNNHVISDENLDYTVILADGTKYPAKVLGTDKYDDIAFLKIENVNLPAAKLGDSDSLETGQTVFAIGNSLGIYQNTVTKGVVSGLGRVLQEESGTTPRLHNLIQTDAAINLGNSGGPLINLAGEVVGINTLIDTGGSNLGFSIPINVVKDSLSQLKTFGKITRPFLGIQFLTIDSEVQAAKNLPTDSGALVASVADQGPAFKAGIKQGDIIVAVNGVALGKMLEIDSVLQKYQAGNQIMLKILRGQEKLELPVILGSYK